ncbi:armadillo repeat-containing protein 10 isoform X1 [Salmo salar]|uniref:Armadillo repeat-containing protein 10 isoform X1 n=2 Tax=Salmo salar TaxID=8030 RepID=A0A1S3ML89_SALSA|nr:armadillo repeat-containing protein 10 isoform X1 [Salmo salar]XP_029552484.1 armadillo repeat-containing protein 10 [Salmo trutta]|eukprot:XP_014003855.1 PREDICTED: armadillo repeat-containing protein 10 isoform X1 [Salmo salar]
MGDGSVIPKFGSMKALLGIVAGAGASYGIYKLLSVTSFKENKKSAYSESRGPKNNSPGGIVLQPGSLLAKVSGLDVVRGGESQAVDVASSDIISRSPGSLEPQHLKMLLSLLQGSPNPSDRAQILITLGNTAAFTVNQDLIRELGGLHVIAGFLSDPVPEVRVQTLNALNNLSMNLRNQEQLKVYVAQVLELIEMSPVNSDLQMAALRLLTNLSVTDDHHQLLRGSITLLLSLLVVSNQVLQIQVLKVLVNLSSNPDMMDDIVQAQAPASVVLLFDVRTSSAVLLRLLMFAGNLKAWRPSAQVAEALRRRQDGLYRVLLDESSQLQSKLIQLLSHPDGEVRAQVARVLL